MKERATAQEINDYISEHYGDRRTANLPPLEKLVLAGEIANATGKVVHCNGINVCPDKPRDKVADAGFFLLRIMFYVFVSILCLGWAVVIMAGIP
jgi:hypothetical protein